MTCAVSQAALQPLTPAQKADMIAAYRDMVANTQALFPSQATGQPGEAGPLAAAGLSMPASDTIPVSSSR